MAAFGSADLNPIEFPNDSSYVTIAGVNSPGVIAPGGITGFERQTEWDKKKGKGTGGATLTLVQFPPCEGSIEFLLWLPEHWTQWVDFRKALKFTVQAKADNAVSIYHPSLVDINLSTVVVAKISPITQKGSSRLYSCTVEFIEWIPPPKKSVVKTPSKGSTSAKTPGAPSDPIADAQQREIAALLKQASAP